MHACMCPNLDGKPLVSHRSGLVRFLKNYKEFMVKKAALGKFSFKYLTLISILIPPTASHSSSFFQAGTTRRIVADVSVSSHHNKLIK
jgi:hypothetical protein